MEKATFTAENIIIKVYPQAEGLSEQIQQAVASGHLWVKVVQEPPISYLVFSRHALDDGEAYMILREHLADEMAQHGS